MLIPIQVVRSGFIASGNVAWPHAASGIARSGHIGDAAVVSGSIASGQVSSGHFASGTILPNNITSGGVTSGDVASGSVMGFFGSTRNVASGTVGVFDFGSGAVVAGSVGSGAVQSGNIASGQIGHNHIASGRLDGFELGSGSIVSGRIASGQVGFGHLANGAVQSGSIASGQIAKQHLASGTPPTTSYGLSILAATFNITSGNDSYQDTGLSMSLPNAGVYLIWQSVKGTVSITDGTVGSLISRLWDVTNDVIVSGSECAIVRTVFSGTNSQNRATGANQLPFQVAGSTTVRLEATRNGASGWGVTAIGTGNTGQTMIGYTKLADL